MRGWRISRRVRAGDCYAQRMIRVERHTDTRFARVAEIVLDRADKRNAMTPEMLGDIGCLALELAREEADALLRFLGVEQGALVLRAQGLDLGAHHGLARTGRVDALLQDRDGLRQDLGLGVVRADLARASRLVEVEAVDDARAALQVEPELERIPGRIHEAGHHHQPDRDEQEDDDEGDLAADVLEHGCRWAGWRGGWA